MNKITKKTAPHMMSQILTKRHITNFFFFRFKQTIFYQSRKYKFHVNKITTRLPPPKEKKIRRKTKIIK